MKSSQVLRQVMLPMACALPLCLGFQGMASAADKEPNILVIWGDDVGINNISAYSLGVMGYKTPNIDSIAKDGALFTDAYAQQSCTAGRASFITGEHPFRTGLLTVGLPGSPQGIPDWAPTIADLLKDKSYATAQFGKNHLGDWNKFLPTVRGFDEFFGNLYHLNAEEEPETYYYPKDPEFKKNFGPRGVLHTYATDTDDPTVDPRFGKIGKQRIDDTGPLTRERMPTIDTEFYDAEQKFVAKAAKDGKPFFVWFNTTRMHVWTRLQKSAEGRTGISVYADGMVEHDDMVGQVLKQLDDLGIADNTIVVYGTDNGAETVTWPDGGTTPFHGEKGTTWEGGFRVPMVVRWPGVIKPGTIFNDIFSQEDWLPTLLAAAGEPDIVEKLKNGYQANGKTWKVHADGYNFLPYFKGEAEKGPREEIFYFAQAGDLNAVRWNDWKISFAQENGNIRSAVRDVTAWPEVVNLRADPYEKAPRDSDLYMRWYADNMWIFVPLQQKLQPFLVSLTAYPFQRGVNLNPANLNYNSLQLMQAAKRLNELQTVPALQN
jgi:arylsulfatase A-like enzyme